MKVELVYSAEQWERILSVATANSIPVAAVFKRRLKPPCDVLDKIKITDEAVCVETPPLNKTGGKKKK